MKYKALLLKYLILKNKIIYDNTKIEYLNLKDIDEILCHWLEKECKFVLDHMSGIVDILLSDYECNPDVHFCPWCTIATKLNMIGAYNSCRDCGYGIRHGFCDNHNSNYRFINEAIGGSLSDLKEVKYLIINIVKEYKRIKGADSNDGC